jgi:hypothetical protein
MGGVQPPAQVEGRLASRVRTLEPLEHQRHGWSIDQQNRILEVMDTGFEQLIFLPTKKYVSVTYCITEKK